MDNELFQQMAFPRYFQGGVVGLVVTDAKEVGGEIALDVQLFPGIPELEKDFVDEVFGQLRCLYQADEIAVDLLVVAVVNGCEGRMIAFFQLTQQLVIRV